MTDTKPRPLRTGTVVAVTAALLAAGVICFRILHEVPV